MRNEPQRIKETFHHVRPWRVLARQITADVSDINVHLTREFPQAPITMGQFGLHDIDEFFFDDHLHALNNTNRGELVYRLSQSRFIVRKLIARNAPLTFT